MLASMWETWRGYGRFARLAVRASPALSLLTLVAMIAAATSPLGAVVAVGMVVSQVSDPTALPWAIAAGGFFLLQWAAGALQTAAAGALRERVDANLQRDLMTAVLRPVGIGQLEDPERLDLLNVGRETFRSGWSTPGRLANTMSSMLGGRIVLVGSCLIVGGFQPVLGVALFFGGLWAAYEDKAASRIEANHHHTGTETARRTEYYYDLGVNPPAAKEVRIFGLDGFLLERYLASWRMSMETVLAPTSKRPLVATVALGVAVLGGLIWIAFAAARGAITVGPAVVYAQALMVSLGGVRQSSWTSLQTELALATLRRYDEAADAFSAPPTMPEGTVAANDLPQLEIRFERVSFSYPGGKSDALHELDLVMPVGRSLAIVGANGAGKSTLVKLLCKMYKPTSGRILVDGIDLALLDAESWRQQLAAVFQDSTRFALPARTNVEFGNISAASDLAGVEAAATAAGVADAVGGLPSGWETPLSAEYDGGVDLSGGEWQKIGLARAMFAISHGASVLVLDEPAAHLDARAEAQLYARFLELTSGLTTVVISHRFSTVRQASSIVVIDGGRVIEQGTHAELLAQDGEYATMFRLQASRFSGAVS